MRSEQYLIGIVDDDRRVLAALENLLASADYAVSLHETAESLLASPNFLLVDGLISDVGLAGMNGLDLLRHVRNVRPALGVIIISGRLDAQALRDTEQIGATFSFTKPFDGLKMLKAVDALTGRAHPAPSFKT